MSTVKENMNQLISIAVSILKFEKDSHVPFV